MPPRRGWILFGLAMLQRCRAYGATAGRTGSDDGGGTWTKHGGSGGIAPLLAVRYRVNGQWSPFSGWVQAES